MDTPSAPIPVIKVLFTLIPGVDALSILGPLEVLNQAQHNPADPSTKAFECIYAADNEIIEASQGCAFKAHVTYDEAYKRLKEFDLMIIPHGDPFPIIKAKSQPLQLIKAFADLQLKDPNKERTVLSIGTGSFLLAQLGILSGLSATTHPDFIVKFENFVATIAARDLAEKADVMEERYVVNNLRFDLGDENQNPYIRRKSDAHRRPSLARKGSNAWRESNTRLESNARRAAMRLGGLRVITAGGSGCAVDASLYLVTIMTSAEMSAAVADGMQHTWAKGTVVDGLDI